MLNAAVTVLRVKDQLLVGERFEAAFRVQNTGTETFLPGVHRLGSMAPQDNQNWGNTRVEIQQPIPPGVTAEFVAVTLVAMAPGILPFSWKMLQEGRQWFGGPSAPVMLTVTAGPPPPPEANVWPEARKDPYDLVSKEIINTRAFAADNQQRQFAVANDSGRRLLITAARMWLGVSLGGRADCHGEVFRNDGSPLAVIQADHYCDGPHGAAVEHFRYEPYFCWDVGELLTLVCFANGFSAPQPQAHFTARVWGRWDK